MRVPGYQFSRHQPLQFRTTSTREPARTEGAESQEVSKPSRAARRSRAAAATPTAPVARSAPLNRAARAAKPQEASAPAPTANATTAPPMTLEGLMAAWGQNDSPYDLNHDRTVNVDDLIQFLAGMPHEEQSGPQLSKQDAARPEPALTTAPPSFSPSDAAPVPPPPAAPESPSGDLSLHGLLEAWGPTDSPYDLNADKTVNVTDLIQFLLDYPSGSGGANGAESVGGSGAAADAPVLSTAPGSDATPESIPAPPANPLADLKGLYEAWGQTGSPFDLNEDKTVNVNDLIQFLLDYPSGSAADAALSTQEQKPVDEVDAPAAQDPRTLDGLLAAWGETDSAYDVNGDATVNVTDLIRFLLSMPSGQDQSQAASGPGNHPGGRPENHHGARMVRSHDDHPDVGKARSQQMAQLRQFSDAFLDRLSAAGYESRPPSGLRDHIAGLTNLDDFGKRFLLRQVTAYYRGADVDLRG